MLITDANVLSLCSLQVYQQITRAVGLLCWEFCSYWDGPTSSCEEPRSGCRSPWRASLPVTKSVDAPAASHEVTAGSFSSCSLGRGRSWRWVDRYSAYEWSGVTREDCLRCCNGSSFGLRRCLPPSPVHPSSIGHLPSLVLDRRVLAIEDGWMQKFTGLIACCSDLGAQVLLPYILTSPALLLCQLLRWLRLMSQLSGHCLYRFRIILDLLGVILSCVWLLIRYFTLANYPTPSLLRSKPRLLRLGLFWGWVRSTAPVLFLRISTSCLPVRRLCGKVDNIVIPNFVSLKIFQVMWSITALIL